MIELWSPFSLDRHDTGG